MIFVDAGQLHSRRITLLHVTETKTCRSADESQKLCDTFVVFFNDKIQKAIEAIKIRLSSHRTQPLQLDTAFNGWPLDGIQPAIEDEQVVTCRLHTDFRQLAKLSFSEGKFPSRYKTASVTPLVKKKDPDSDVARNYNYRPISNLHTLYHIQDVRETVHGTHPTSRRKLS